MHGRVEAPHSNRRDLENLRKLSTYLFEYRGRVLLALGCLVISKLAVVAVPLVLKRIVDTLDGATSAYRDAVLLNSAAALVVAGMEDDLKTAAERAADSIDSGRAKAKLDAVVRITQSA